MKRSFLNIALACGVVLGTANAASAQSLGSFVDRYVAPLVGGYSSNYYGSGYYPSYYGLNSSYVSPYVNYSGYGGYGGYSNPYYGYSSASTYSPYSFGATYNPYNSYYSGSYSNPYGYNYNRSGSIGRTLGNLLNFF